MNYQQAIKYKLDNYEETKKEFIVKFEQDPHDALIWSASMFEVACKIKVCTEVLNELEKGTSVDAILSTLRRAVDSISRYPQQSTSATSNLIHQCEGPALWELIDLLSQ